MKSAEAWIGALPKANVGEMARQTYQALLQLNRMELPDSHCLKLCDRFTELVDFLDGALERHFVDTAFPLSQKGERVASLVRELYLELSIAPKVVVERNLAGIHEAADQRLLTVALHRAIRHLGCALYEAVHVYQPWLPQAWREIHLMYAYAIDHGLDKVPVRTRLDDPESPTSTIGDLYRQLIVLGTAEPHRLRQREIKTVFENGLAWGRDLVFLPPQGAEIKASHRLIDLASDREPLLVERLAGTEQGRFLLVDLGPLAARLRSELEKVPADNNGGRAHWLLSSALLRRLSDGWENASRRRFPRTRLVFELNVVVGLSAIHSELLGKVDATPGQAASLYSTDSTAASKRLENQSLGLVPLGTDRTSPAFRKGAEALGPAETAIPWVGRAGEPADEGHSLTVKTANESASGYCIEWHSQNAPKIRVGEVIGVQSTAEERQFAIGLMRWMQYTGPDSLRVGVEMIAPRCQPVQSHVGGQVPLRYRAGLKTQPALKLPAFQATGRSTSQLLANVGLKEGDSVWLFSDTADQLVRLGEMLDATGSCARFAYEVLKETHKVAKGAEASGAGADKRASFDDLWSQL
jgi:hypothetical protein